MNDLVTNGSAVRAENGNLKKAQNGHANGAPGLVNPSNLSDVDVIGASCLLLFFRR